MKVQVKKLHNEAILPSYAHAEDAGFDLYTYREVTLHPGERASIGTGLSFAIPEGYAGLVWDKSGLSHRSGIKTLGGVLDSGYTGELFVGLLNTDSKPYTFEAGQKIAQMLVQKVEHVEFDIVTELTQTERGQGGLGSTGK